MSRKSKTELEFQLRGKRLDRLADLLIQLIRSVGWVICVFIIAGALKAFAGQHTFADLGFKFLADLKVSDGLIALFGGSGVVYGYSQRRLRRNTIETLGPRAKKNEEAVDPQRSSSRLTTRGTTPKKKP